MSNVTVRDDADTALQTRLNTNVTAFTNEDTALQARITANNQTAASNDFITFTRLNANVDIVQDNVATNATDIAAVEARRVANTDSAENNAAAVEARRVANIAGAVSTITTSDLTASRAVVSDGSGKIAVSAVTSTEIGHLDGVTSGIQTQLDGVEARRAANLVSATFTGEVSMSDDLIVTGNLTVNGETTTVNSENKVIQDRFIMLANSVSGAPSADVGILFNRGTSGNAALFYDESAKFFTLSETRDPDTNVAISPTGAANLSVGQFTASSVAFDGSDLNTAITDNVATLNTADTALQSRLSTNVTAFTNEDTALQTRLDTNVTAFTNEDTALQSRLSTNVTAFTNEDTALQVRITANTGVAASNDFITFTRLNANVDVVQDNVVAAEANVVLVRSNVDSLGSYSNTTFSTVSNAQALAGEDADIQARLATNVTAFTNEDTALQSRLATNVTAFTNEDTALQSRLTTNVTAFTNEDTALQARITANNQTAASNDFITFTRLNANVDVVQDNVASIIDGTAGFTGDLTVTTTDDGDAASPIFNLVRNSGSPADADYLGQIKFKGENDADQSVTYAKISGKIGDVTDGTEDGIIEFSIFKGGSNHIPVRINSNGLFLNNGNDLKFEGTTGDANETTLTAGEPTGDRTITLPDATGTVALTSQVDTVSDNSAAVESRRVANIAGAVSTITTSDLTASRALVSGSGGKVEVSAITSTELAFLDGLDQNLNANLVALAAGVAGAATNVFPTGDFGLLDAANAATDAFGFATADLDLFDMSNTPSGELSTQDLGAFT